MKTAASTETAPASCSLDLASMVSEVAPIYHQYPGQLNPQPCYIEIDCAARTYTAAYDPEIGGGVPVDVWHNHRLRFQLPQPEITGSALAEWLESAPLITLITRVCDGYESVWNGSNHVAQFDDDARAAIDDLEIASYRGDWLVDSGSSRQTTSARSLGINASPMTTLGG